jgi:hypothetical protein
MVRWQYPGEVFVSVLASASLLIPEILGGCTEIQYNQSRLVPEPYLFLDRCLPLLPTLYISWQLSGCDIEEFEL